MVKAGSDVDEPPGELPHCDPEGHIRRICTSMSVEDIWCVCFRQEVGRLQEDERTRSQAHVILPIMFAGGRRWKVLVLLMIQTHNWYGGVRW